MFKRPKKPISRRVFTGNSDDEAETEKMSVDPPIEKKSKDRDKKPAKEASKAKLALLSFGDEEEEEGDVFQVKKSSHSKKFMKERRKKKKELESAQKDKVNSNGTGGKLPQSGINPETDTTTINEYSNNIQTEIRTDDFVLVVKNTQPEVILNGRAALCAGKNDMSSEEDDVDETGFHKYQEPDHFKMVLESGIIPDAAMIHAARKRRQKARELGDFVPLEEKSKDSKSSKDVGRNSKDDDGSDEDEERVDMSAITGMKDLEERREQFYQAQQYSGDSDQETNEWENQQIRKGVTGAQIVSAQQESVFANIMLQSSFANTFTNSASTQLTMQENKIPLSTADLLKQAYANINFNKPKIQDGNMNRDTKVGVPKTPNEILDKMMDKIENTREMSRNHLHDIQRVTQEIATLYIEAEESKENAPLSGAKYRFYQETKYYLLDLIECLDEKAPQISALEQRSISTIAKFSNNLIERRRQDVRDQAKDMAEASKPVNLRKSEADDPVRIRRAAEREGRRTRRRRDREKNEINDTHLEGMSSDDEVHDHEMNQYINILEAIENEAREILLDAADDFVRIPEILSKFEDWKRKQPDAYNEAFVHLCIPKILGPLIRLKLIMWNPLSEKCEDFEEMQWYEDCMRYAIEDKESEDSLLQDVDSRLVPSLIEKIILPKLNDYIESVWDPMSTTQTFRLVKLISRLGRDYPSMRPNSKALRNMFTALLEKIKSSIENDVFIPIFPKQIQEGRSSFFQRQFYSGLKLFRNILSWQGILADEALKQLAVLSLLNRYLLLAMRSCSPIDAVSKANTILYTMPRVWLAQDSPILVSLEMFAALLRHIKSQLDINNPMHVQSIENLNKILKSLHIYE